MATEKRLIDANALVDAVEDIDWYHFNLLGKLVDGANPAHNTPLYKAFDIYNAIKNAPTVDAVEVVHGRWIELPTPRVMWKYRCDKCGCPQDYKHNYCPNCGAKMDGDGNG